MQGTKEKEKSLDYFEQPNSEYIRMYRYNLRIDLV
nr:MAG TPA: Fez1 [Bacteriophage sp.]